MAIHLGRNITGHLNAAIRREWLVTNGLGGYASGSISGARTRRYHGLLIASLAPPTQRHLMVAGLDAWVEVEGRRWPISTHEWAAGVALPDGYNNLESVRLEGTIPVFRWALGMTCVEQRIWMAYGENTTYITWTLTRGNVPLRLILKPLVTFRSHHDITVGGANVVVTSVPSPWKTGLAIDILASEYLGTEKDHSVPSPVRIMTSGGKFHGNSDWWWDFHLDEEGKRGMVDHEDLFQAGTIEATLEPGHTFCMVCTVESAPPKACQAALDDERQRQQNMLSQSRFQNAPDWIRQLILAADQFIVDIGNPKETYIVSGYPWFGVWGRATMVSLTGLTSAIGRTEMAANVLRTFAKYIDKGMLPNNLSDVDGVASYNSIDTSLWFFIATWAYMRECPDDTRLLEELYPILVQVIEEHAQGARYQIAETPNDGLLYGGEYGMQLTWMDVKINDWVVTPRIGKAVEVNALWYNALCIIHDFAERLEKWDDMERYAARAKRVFESFNKRFWSEQHGYLYDVIDIPGRPDDATLRPNQLLALSLPFGAITDYHKAKRIVDVCARELLTSYGLRTLTPDHEDYIGVYTGSPQRRDNAYHQGTVWAWLIGPFVSAYLTVYNDPETARTFLEPFADHLHEHGLGTIAEIFDGNTPFRPHGAIAQAWSVSEVLRVWWEIERRSKG
ncbi:MAG: glycogen debranching protein [Chloroflexi bacterium]|nr:glycogen debranching protein [Chloroflexota bacterium]